MQPLQKRSQPALAAYVLKPPRLGHKHALGVVQQLKHNMNEEALDLVPLKLLSSFLCLFPQPLGPARH